MAVAAGLLAFRFPPGQRPSSLESSSLTNLEVFLAHPGGPYWAKKDDGAWTIPKGMCDPDEDLLAAGIREFVEETGFSPPDDANFLALGEVKMRSSSKRVHGWAFEVSGAKVFDPAQATSNTFEAEWPPKSGRLQTFPEVDRVQWFHWKMAEQKLLAAQAVFVDRLCRRLIE